MHNLSRYAVANHNIIIVSQMSAHGFIVQSTGSHQSMNLQQQFLGKRPVFILSNELNSPVIIKNHPLGTIAGSRFLPQHLLGDFSSGGRPLHLA